jgi:hypothetical protein
MSKKHIIRCDTTIGKIVSIHCQSSYHPVAGAAALPDPSVVAVLAVWLQPLPPLPVASLARPEFAPRPV